MSLIKLFLTSSIFIMGLLSSSEWFQFYTDTARPNAAAKKRRAAFSTNNKYLIILVSVDSCYVIMHDCP